MSGFSSHWLDLREPYDAAARDNAATAALVDGLAGRRLRVVDLGTGTGANMRFLAPRLGPEQRWRLIDADPMLLASARGRVAPRGVAVDILHHDLADPWTRPSLAGADLVTASALLDLVDERFIAWLAEALVRHGVALHLALSYDGRLAFEPHESGDAEVHALFDLHQRGEKGFGPALGPDGWRVARDRLEAVGSRVTTCESDWRLDPSDRAIQRALLDGFAAAAVDMAPARAFAIAGWHARRSDHVAEGRSRMTVGHVCVTALPAA